MIHKIFIALGSVLLSVPLLAQAQSSTQAKPSQSEQNQSSQMQNNQTQNNQNLNNQNQNQNQNTTRKEQLSDLSAQMLNNAAQARIAARNQDKQDALMYIGRAQRELQQIRGERSDSKMVPIYSEVTDVWVLGPVLNARGPQQSAVNQEAPSNPQSNQSAQNHGIAFRDIRDRYTGIWLDTSGDQAHLEAARNAIDSGNFAAARTALNAVQDSLVVERVSGDLPLMKARENLILAREAANRGDHAEEQTAIRAADHALREYAKDNGRHAQQAEQLCQQMTQQASANVSANQINQWWNEVSDWTNPGPARG